MAAHADYPPEFDLVDSDDGLGPSPLAYLEFINSDDPDTLQSYDASRAADQKALLTPGPNPPPPLSNSASSPESPSSTFPDSSSDSSSSKQTASSASTKTGFAAGDVMMTDGLDLSHEWKVEDLVHTEDDANTFASDGTINPMSIGNAFALDASVNATFEFNSPASTPSPFTNGPPEPTPVRQTHAGSAKAPKHAKLSSPSARQSSRGHTKAISVSNFGAADPAGKGWKAKLEVSASYRTQVPLLI
jgi:hypothetical protein